MVVISVITALSIYFLLMDWANKPENLDDIFNIFKKYGVENGVRFFVILVHYRNTRQEARKK